MVSVIHMSSHFMRKRYTSLLSTVQRDTQGNVFHIKLWQYKWRYKLILSHLKIKLMSFSYILFSVWHLNSIFNNWREFLSQQKKVSKIELPKNFLFQLIYCMCFCAFLRVAFPVEKKSLRRKIFVREQCKLYLGEEEKYFESTLQ